MSRNFLAALAIASALIAPLAAPAAEPILGAYYPGGSAARYPVASIPAERLTHLFYAFARIEDGRCIASPESAAHFDALKVLKQQHPRLRALISIGGWEAGGFSDAALTPESRARFVSSCLALFFERHRGAFDGVDIDWEFPVYGGPKDITDRPEDRANMTLLAKEFRRQLDALARSRGQDEGYLLTAALPAGRVQSDGAYDPARSYDLRALGQTLDFINLMTYDMGTAFSAVSTFNAPLREVADDPLPDRRWNNVEGAVDFYREHGVPADKLVLGVPFYGRGFRVTGDAGDGLYQPYSAPFAAGDWREIRAKLLADPAWERRWHPVAQTPWLFNREQGIFVSYEDARSIGLRSQLAKDRGLGGVFMWELTGDDEEQSLLGAMVAPFEQAKASPAGRP